uniref:DUF1206 domain-containing protein n=1 Tax=uncultured Erythrobacter sp. TaxID=263913 RepID=UPI002614C793|nr:DUF1206 domain-containing protein [uncultured Erythrobacter sp.]
MVDKTEKFNWLVRLGYFSRAVLYSVLGIIALTSAGKIGKGTDGIFNTINGLPGGTLLLWILVIGLFAYALFRFASPVFDIENNGTDAKGWGKRIGHAGSAIAHVALAWTAYQFASSGSASDGGGASQAASGVLSIQFGAAVIGVLGLAFFIAALAQAKKAISGDFMNRISGNAPSSTRMLGGLGYAARAVVYTVIGWSLVQTGFLSSGADNIKTLGAAVASLTGSGWLFTLTAIGLLMFGIFSLILARYQIIPELDKDAGIPNFRT